MIINFLYLPTDLWRYVTFISFSQMYSISNESNSLFPSYCLYDINSKQNYQTCIYFYSFTLELNDIVSPWIAFALLTHQLLLVAEVFQLALVSACRYAITADVPCPVRQSCWLYHVHLTVPLRRSELFGNCGLILLCRKIQWLPFTAVSFNMLPTIMTVWRLCEFLKWERRLC